jgi:hypothetical protein
MIVLVCRQIFAITAVTFQELLREKVLWSALVFAFLCVGLAYAVSQLSFADNARIALDFGLASISIVGGLISIIMGAALIAKEIHNRTLYVVLTKSIWRWQFVLGRFCGLLGVLSVNTVLMAAVLLLVHRVAGGAPDASLAESLFLQLTEFGVLAAAACMFSALSTATLAAIFTAGIWVIGHANADLKVLASKIEPLVLRPVLDFVARVLPDLARFDIKAEVSHQLPVTWAYVTTGMAASTPRSRSRRRASSSCGGICERDPHRLGCRVRGRGGQLPQRRDLPRAPRVQRAAPLPLGLPVVREKAALARERPAPELSLAAGPLPRLRRKDLAALSARREHDRGALRRRLSSLRAQLRDALLLRVRRRPGGGNVH